LPESARNLAQIQIEGKLKEAENTGPPDATPAQKAFYVAMLQEFAKTAIRVLKEGSEFSIDLDLDKTRGDFSIGVSLSGVPKSDLAKNIAAVGQSQSLFAGLRSKKNAFFGAGHATMPEDMKKTLGKAIDDGMAKALSEI